MAGTRCVYCGAPLPKEAVGQATTEPAAGADRLLVVVDLGSGAEEDAARALGLSLFDLRQLSPRGNLHLHRVLPPDEARVEASLIADLGLRVVLVSESDVRRAASPLVVRGGRWAEGVLHAQTARGPLRLCRDDVLLLVQGPIVRERQVAPEVADLRNLRRLRRVHTASLTQGYRYHLHRRSEPVPVEIDPLAFELGAAAPSSSSSDRRLAERVADLAAGAAVDDTFRRQVPALGPASGPSDAPFGGPVPSGRAAGRGKQSAAQLLDNVAQFRFHSAWRGLVERAQVGLSAPSNLVLPSGPGP
jgi:hypothetical protein